ncbi:hypothetical protein EUGRSUZ_K00854 [Eucalyptus grandis]|uniref:Uncharacterized protein n=2 Tax=Eucalyptus grandis TaxID=71139 RepID=A0ACC3IRP8_EUCGR|nr:hypothetical protein EUGRSUZ_K00854 [Eucalyptus grandis]
MGHRVYLVNFHSSSGSSVRSRFSLFHFSDVPARVLSRSEDHVVGKRPPATDRRRRAHSLTALQLRARRRALAHPRPRPNLMPRRTSPKSRIRTPTWRALRESALRWSR